MGSITYIGRSKQLPVKSKQGTKDGGWGTRAGGRGLGAEGQGPGIRRVESREPRTKDGRDGGEVRGQVLGVSGRW